MAVHVSHASLPYPIKGARFSLLVPYLNATGDPTAPSSPDTEISKDAGAAADCAEEVSAVSGMDGIALMTFSGAEMDCTAAAIKAGATGPKPTLLTLFPKVLAVVSSGTASAGAAGSLTLGTILRYDITGCFLKTTGGTGGGGTGGANNQARKITAYNRTTGVATVSPNWETTPDNTTTYDVLLPDGVTPAMVQGLKWIVETEGSYDAAQVLSLGLAALAGRTNGSIISTPNNNATRIDATIVGSNRTAITLTPSA